MRAYSPFPSQRPPRCQRERGAALIVSLVVVVIFALLIGAVSGISTQDYNLALRQRDAAAALDTAESAVNWELNKMARYEATGSSAMAPNQGDPENNLQTGQSIYSGPLPSNSTGSSVQGGRAIQGTVTVSITNLDRSIPYQSPGDFRLFATGTVNGITRSIQLYGGAVGLGDIHTLYGINSLDIKKATCTINSAAGASSTPVVGTAGTCDVKKDASLTGTASFDWLGNSPGAWGNTSGNGPGWEWLRTRYESLYPTVQDIGLRVLRRMGAPIDNTTEPLAYFKANNDNDAWIKAAVEDENKVETLVDVVWPNSDKDHVQIDTDFFNANDPPKSEKKTLKRIVIIGDSALVGNNARGSNIYLEKLDIPNKRTLEIRNGYFNNVTYGPVRLWIGPKGDKGSAVRLRQGTIITQSRDRDSLLIYNGTDGEVRLGGLTTVCNDAQAPNRNAFYGTIYSYNRDSSNNGYGNVDIEDDFTYVGSIIGWSVRHNNGALTASRPAQPSGSPDPYKYILFFRLRDNWAEINALNPSGGSL